MASARTSIESLPTACAASTWKCAGEPAARSAAAICAIGCTTPISFCTATIDTTAARAAAAATASGSSTPSSPGATRMTSRPSPASRSASVPTAGCSNVDSTIAPGFTRAAPSTASAFDSLQPLVQITSPVAGSASPSAASIRSRAASRCARAAAPCGCCELGLPHAVRITSIISASASSATRVEAALSRYIGVMQLGVYLHFPWCRKRCPYCDFAIALGEPLHARYADAVLAELAARADAYRGEGASLYGGGGRPWRWQPDELARVIAAVRTRWPHARATLEVTIEANPCDVVPERLAAWRDAGVNRLSIGVQSHAADELVALGRDHRFGDGAAAIERAATDGAFDVSVDYILGVPSGRTAAPPRPPATAHASVYELTIEDRTAFGARVRAGTLAPLPDDALADLYIATHDAFTAAGFEHYEISSYARPGKRAVHNSLYWQGVPYLGLGASAASLALAGDGAGSRTTNARDVAAYLAGAAPEVLLVPAAEMAVDRAWLGMRTSDGVAEHELAAGVASELVDGGLAERSDGRIRPTLRGFLMADRVAARIVAAG